MLRFFQLAFWLAVSITLYLTLRPITLHVPASDKAQHLLTFAALMLIAASAYPRARLVPLGLALSGFGGLIELVQPKFQRSGELLDWVADSVGILLALLGIWVARRYLASATRSER